MPSALTFRRTAHLSALHVPVGSYLKAAAWLGKGSTLPLQRRVQGAKGANPDLAVSAEHVRIVL